MWETKESCIEATEHHLIVRKLSTVVWRLLDSTSKAIDGHGSGFDLMNSEVTQNMALVILGPA